MHKGLLFFWKTTINILFPFSMSLKARVINIQNPQKSYMEIKENYVLRMFGF